MTLPTFVLGINYFPTGDNDIGHHPSAALLRNGAIIAMVEEERLVRVKEAPRMFPIHSIAYCLKQAGIGIDDVDAIGWNWNPVLSAERSKCRSGRGLRAAASLAQWSLRNTPAHRLASMFTSGLLPERIVEQVKARMLYWVGGDPNKPFFCFDHHLAHAASTYYTSGFSRATIVTWDCWGDQLSGLVARGDGGEIEVLEEVPFDHMSLGRLNDFVFDFLRTSEKGNLMGLAAYGTPRGLLEGLADPATQTMRMDVLSQTAPFSKTFTDRVGQPRRGTDPLQEAHKDLAADLQLTIEAFGHQIVEHAVKVTGIRDLCLAGGVGLNATMNGKLSRSGLIDRIFIHPEAGDAGGALGAAFLAHLELGRKLLPTEMPHAYWGPSFTTDEITEQVETVKVNYEILPERDVPPLVAETIASGKVVGWFQLGTEWGPRSLGARSIIADPRLAEVRDKVNLAVKYRDWWRPFAPSMLATAAADYLEQPFYAPFMIVTFPVLESRKAEIRGVLHCDGTTRPQMVCRDMNPLYHDTIKAFGDRTGTPMVLNTSFNLKGEPIVNSPRDALRTFFSSGLDMLVMNNVVLRKQK